MPPSSPICSFALSLPVYQLFDYELDGDTKYAAGTRFKLPFGRGEKLGILVSCNKQQLFEYKNIKTVVKPLDDDPILSTHLMQLASWLADYYCQPLGEVLFQFLPRLARKTEVMPETRVQFWSLNTVDDELLLSFKSKAPRQYDILCALKQSDNGLDALQLRQVHDSWHQPVKVLQDKGLVTKGWRENLPVAAETGQPGFELTVDQQKICDEISPHLNLFLVHLIHGVTGSGKTEVYLELMEQVIRQGKQVIYLVPEIGLTPQLLRRLQSRLGQSVVSSHSAMTGLQRYQSWDQFKRGVAQVIIGTRSALFSESSNLGLIIIDEEHDSSFRQQDGVRYHARDVAIKRSQMLDIPIVLGSATPSLESLFNVQKTHFRLYRLDQRVGQSKPPQIELLDCSQIPLNTGCSPKLLQSIKEHLAAQGQVLLFLNRRGFAPVVMCHECGWQSTCYQCDARMTLHQSVNKLICHHCGFSVMLPHKCPDCGTREIRHYGVGTQQLEEFLKSQFPGIDVIRIDRDSIKSAKHFEARMQPVRDAKPCILVGTQMLAKGHDYPHITLVGMLDSDQALYSSFYRASERLIQTVLQVSGRAGRAEKKGQALLQTAFPTHPLMLNLCRQSYSELVEDILQERKMVGFPPFARVVTFQVDAIELALALQKLNEVKQYLSEIDSGSTVKVIGPIPALMTRRVGRYRAQLSILANETHSIRVVLQQLMPKIQAIRNTQKSRLTIEVDPLDL
ncbi:MAG: primosomal protein N' [Gammaproteobacteria bacterium]|jgi:primosomal protein N' (replication factor Y)|nr:primosomal protein N' [Gammaproteobacteria bacterium]MBT3722036.1 primosomal protein N' [Gammaproteobacteria bacterium]MBT4193100.1 primosomal protein N' [Gammaproteobacteria bacterium]MBT4449489.1 primosomal protein N' [Gammaproteobacteria bacterium]MBT4862474.1 primosomal protein N' [Gammaproteobacteria bacterium]